MAKSRIQRPGIIENHRYKVYFTLFQKLNKVTDAVCGFLSEFQHLVEHFTYFSLNHHSRP